MAKDFFTYTIPETKKKLFIRPPKRKLLKKVVSLTEGMGDGNLSEQDIDNIYEAVSEIMSDNKAGIIITIDDLDDTMDIRDIITFIESYMDFISAVNSDPN